MRTQPKSVQIDIDLFYAILDYIHAHADKKDPNFQFIMRGVMDKLGKMVRHNLFTGYKTAESEEDSVGFFNQYLDELGVPESFRFRIGSHTVQSKNIAGGDVQE